MLLHVYEKLYNITFLGNHRGLWYKSSQLAKLNQDDILRLFFDLCHSYFNNFSHLLQRTKLIVASFFGVWFSESIKDCVHMTNMTVMAVYVKPLKISSPKNMALKQHFIKSILDSYTISFVQMI